MLSKAEENYIKAVFHLSDSKNSDVATNQIAEVLETRAASVTDMLKKLAGKKLLHYKRYKGVSLTEKGRKEAVTIIRKHRLWETFLVNKLQFDWDKVHDIAEQLEHIKSPQLISRLDEYLGYPKFDPHGDPIPDVNGVLEVPLNKPLSETQIGEECSVTSVNDSHPSLLKYLKKVNLKIGSHIKILDKLEFDGSMEVLLDNKLKLTLSEEITKTILVT